uniref:Tetraspanin 31 n=2 Tax=Carnivora TaxID=33554 RepID=A0A667GCX4_LYNCA
MVCGGFACSKNALCALNVVYMLVGLLLIGVAAWGKGLGLVSSIHIIGGVIAVGVFLLLIAVAGLVGAVNHHQVLLFFYMIILGLVFIFQFGISCSCLAINRSKQTDVINASWWVMSNKTRDELERSFDCCGLFNLTTLYQQDYAFCTAICKSRSSTCQMCGEKFLKHSDEALKILGGVGLFFSFTEVTFSISLLCVCKSFSIPVGLSSRDSELVIISFPLLFTDPWCLASNAISESEGSSS